MPGISAILVLICLAGIAYIGMCHPDIGGKALEILKKGLHH